MSRRRDPRTVSEARVLCPCGAILGPLQQPLPELRPSHRGRHREEWRKSVLAPCPRCGRAWGRRVAAAEPTQGEAWRPEMTGTRPAGSDHGLRAPGDSRPAGRPGLSTPSRDPDGRRAGLGHVPRGVRLGGVRVPRQRPRIPSCPEIGRGLSSPTGRTARSPRSPRTPWAARAFGGGSWPPGASRPRPWTTSP